MKLPITRYPSIAGHVLPAPVGDMRHMPGMLLQQLRNREVSWEQYIRNEWIAETRTLTPAWRLDGNRVIVDNPRKGSPIKLDDLPAYRIPEEERRLFGGTLALQEAFGVIPLPVFPPIFKGDKVEERRLTPVLKALGMMSYEPSTQSFEAMNAPIRATNPKIADWFVKHFPVDRPLHADAGFAYTHDYVGRYIGLDIHEDMIKYAVEHPDEYRIVWPDPEERQWAAENSPLEFYKKTYGVSSLREVREMPAPVKKIREGDASIPVRRAGREYSSENDDWRKKLLFTLSELGVTSEANLPDFLRPRKRWVTGRQVRSAAKAIVEDTKFPGGLGALPRVIRASGESWTLATAFVALANSLEHYALNDFLPAELSFEEIIGPVEHPLEAVSNPAELDAQVGRLGEIPPNPYLNEVNLLQAVWETAEKVRADQKIPARISVRISEGRRGDFRGRALQVNAAELLYAMAEEIERMEKDGLPDEVPFRRVIITPARTHASSARALDYLWTRTEPASATNERAGRAQILEAAEYLMSAWTAGHLGHQEDIGGPPYSVPLSGGGAWSLNDAFQALAYSLAEYNRTGNLPDQVPVRDVMGPVDYPMCALRSEPAYNTRTLRGGWKPYQIDMRDFPPEELITVQGLPGYSHGSYQAFVEANKLLESVERAVTRLDETGTVPGSVRIDLPPGRRSPRAPDAEGYINAAELLWGMAQLYRYLEVLGSPDDVLLRSCRLIQGQLHFNIVGLAPVGFSRQTYRYHINSFDWIEKVPVWRIHTAWARSH